MTLIDGKKTAAEIKQEIAAEVARMTADGKRAPHLAAILVGHDGGSETYVANKVKACGECGFTSSLIRFEEDVTEERLVEEITRLNDDQSVDGFIVQLPLPRHIDEQNIIRAIDPSKDVDGFTPYNFGKLFSGSEPMVYPCTPKGILLLLDEYGIKLEGKHAVIIGRSNIVGRPLSQMFLNRNATVTVCHSHSENLSDIIKTADIVVSAAGKNIVKGEMLKSGCVVVDVGIFKDENGKTRGDVDFETSSQVASYISPVPGGVGPMTIASLMLNTVELYVKNLG